MDGLIKNLTPQDMERVLSIQRSCYPPFYHESRETFERLLEIFPEGCIGSDAGYAFAHPWVTNSYVPLNSEYLRIPDAPDCMYIHDLSVLPGQRGNGTGRKMFFRILKLTREKGFRYMELVAVQHSEGYWQKLGFKGTEDIVYGGREAKLMILELA
jgi:GNAT superfamily N-acetyltransferase